jgi:hypothetical protein
VLGAVDVRQSLEARFIMTPRRILVELERLVSSEDFPASSEELVARWSSINLGSEAVEPILRFMEEHPAIDFGTPGALVHFAERFYGDGYEERLLDSISRRPTRHTIWMLNRVVNREAPANQLFVAAMVRAKAHPLVDPNTLDQIDRFLERVGIR